VAKKYHSIKGKSALPLPAKPTFKENERTKDGVKFFQYWENLTPELAQMARVRVYRMKPPIDLTKIGERVKSVQVWEGPIPFKAEDYEKEFYEASWAGGGDYRCAIEEIGLSGVVCEVFFSLPDWDTYPPKIADGSLMLESNGGKEYVAWRARRGEPVPGVQEEKDQAEDQLFMESGKSGVAAVVDGFTNLATTLVTEAKTEAREAKQEAKEARERTITPTTDVTTLAVAEGIRLISDVAREQSKNSHAPDAVEMFKAVVGLMPPAPDPAPMFNTILGVVQESNKTMMSMVLQQNQELRQEISQMRNGQSTALAPQKSVGEQLLEMKTNAELLGYSRTGGSSSAAPAKSVMEEWGPIIQMAMTIVAPLMQAITIKLTGTANGAPPIANGQQPQQPIQQAPPQQPPPPPDPPGIQFLKRIEPMFMGHLVSPDSNGFTFANQIVTEGTGIETVAGRSNYNWIKQHFGFKPGSNQCGLDPLIRSYEPMWRVIEQNLPKYQLFLSEFLNYDEQVAPN
jgi:hypothetical protein